MGYTTDFFGRFDLDRAMLDEEVEYLKAFSYTRRMKRNAKKAAALPDPIRDAVNLPVGKQGCFYVGSNEDFGQNHDESVMDYNKPPDGQPSLWCQWVPTEDKQGIEWDGGEKFYEYIPWLKYLIDNFFKPWGYKLNGTVTWAGEDSDDRGVITVKDNEIYIGMAPPTDEWPLDKYIE